MADQVGIAVLRAGWDDRYRDAPLDIPVPAAVLRDYVYLLPPRGPALDLACAAVFTH